MTDELVGYFGYGSLVNPATLRTSYVCLKKARLKGWRRHWQGRRSRTASDQSRLPGDTGSLNLALLSVHPNADTEIDGMLVIDHARHLAQVDAREARYDRISISRDLIELTGPDDDVELPQRLYLYVAQDKGPSHNNEMLLQSYLDAVLAGFHEVHGEDGLERFLATTVGFDRPIHCDRDAPLYPRPVDIAPELATFFDRRLKSTGVRFP